MWLLDTYEWSRFQTRVDVGGGTGPLLADLHDRFPSLTGVLVDAPDTVAQAGPRLQRFVTEGRCTLQPGSFIERGPAGNDAYVLKRITYSQADADARQILARVREAMRTDSRVLIIEPVRHQARASPFDTLLDLQMLVIGGGQVRDRHALRALLRSARLRLHIIPTRMSAIVEATAE